MNARELRIGNFYVHNGEILEVNPSTFEDIWHGGESWADPIQLTEEWLFKFGFSVINESSAGKRYGYVINGVFNSDLTFTFWKTTKEVGKFFRGDLELKSVHQLQNLYFALTGAELTVA